MFDNEEIIKSSIIFSAIKETCDNMLHDPAQLLGLISINTKEILKWSKFEEDKLKLARITNHFQINADDGTGGSVFRKT